MSTTIVQDLAAEKAKNAALDAEVQKLRAAGCSTLSYVGLTDAQLKGLASKGPVASTAAPAIPDTGKPLAGVAKPSTRGMSAARAALEQEYLAITGDNPRMIAQRRAAFRETHKIALGL
jgi:hypothetical protein